jgi:hypothetical protein
LRNQLFHPNLKLARNSFEKTKQQSMLRLSLAKLQGLLLRKSSKGLDPQLFGQG